MADPAVVHTGENSPEHVAFELLLEVAKAENVKLIGLSGETPATRQWLLDAYAECVCAVRGSRSPPPRH